MLTFFMINEMDVLLKAKFIASYSDVVPFITPENAKKRETRIIIESCIDTNYTYKRKENTEANSP